MGSDVSRPSEQQSGFAKRRGSSKKMTQMSRRLSMGPPSSKKEADPPPSIRVGGSTGVLSVEDNDNELLAAYQQQGSQQSSRLSLSIDQLNTPRSRSGSSSSQSPTKPKHRCSLSLKNRQLIQSCFNNPHENIGYRILKRAAERRKDFGRFYMAVSAEQREQIGDTIKMLLKKSVACVECADDELLSLAIEFGQRFVEYRLHGFKADYFAALADSTITECVLLDAAVHPAALTLNAFSQFITMLFSSVRDGFYTEMRRLRRISNSFSTVSNGSVSRKKLSVEDALKGADREKLQQQSAVAQQDGGDGRRGSNGGSPANRRGSNTSPRSLSPSEEKIAHSKSASPFGGSSQEEELVAAEQPKKGGKQRKSNSRSPSRKISPGSTGSSAGGYGGIGQMKAKDELKLITAEFLNSGVSPQHQQMAFGKENSNGTVTEEKPRMAVAI